MELFEQLKRNQTHYSNIFNKERKAKKISFLIDFDSKGGFVDVVDEKMIPAVFDYNDYNGVERELTKEIRLINDKQAFLIDWENPDNRIYLSDHPYLTKLLQKCEKIIDNKGNRVKTSDEEGTVFLQLDQNSDDRIKGSIVLKSEGRLFTKEVIFISEDCVYLAAENTLILIKPVGPNFNLLSLFNTDMLPAEERQKILSLFFSYFNNVALKYEDYKTIRKKDSLAAKPMIVFEKVDQDQSLYMRLTQVIPGSDIHFLDDYDLDCFVFVNELDKSIVVHPIEQVSFEKAAEIIDNTLKPYQPKGNRKKTHPDVVRDGSLYIIPEKIASDFIYKEVPRLLNDFAIAGSEKLKDYKINVHKPRLNVTLGHGIDFLDGEASLEFGDQSISLGDALLQFKRNKYILLSDGTHAIVNEQYMHKLQRLFRKKKGNKGEIEISFFDLPLIEELIEEKESNAAFKKARSVYEGFNDLEKKRVTLPKVNAVLRPYQVQGYKWLKYLYDNNLGGCLADDMGLGKTLQTITLLTDIYSRSKKELQPSLLVMPRSLIFNWEKELVRFSPSLTFYTWYGSNRDWDQAGKHQLILTTYALLRNDIEIWKEKKFLYAILDESQATKNYNSQVHKASLLLNTEHRLALSGTPVENNLSELFALFRFLNPGMFSGTESFNQNYLTPIQKYNDQDAALELKRKIYPFILRRQKKQVLKDLPEKIEQTLYVEMNAAQERFYEQRRLFYKNAIDQQVAMKGIQKSQFFIFQALNELRQIATIPESQTDGKIKSAKLDLLMENIEDSLSNGHKALVFCNFLSAVELIGEALDKRDIDFVTMTGSTRNRKELVERFQRDEECKVFLLTLKTGGTGLNLTAADTVFTFDPWWNVAAENQAIDRTHRIGQTQKVMSYKLITIGTIEEKMLQLQEVKKKLFEDIISAESGSSLKSITEDDIRFILG